MPVFSITVSKDYDLEDNKLAKGMNVQFFCMYPSPIIYNGIYIKNAFVRKYGFDLKGIGWNTSEFMDITIIEQSTLEDLNNKLEFIQIEKLNASLLDATSRVEQAEQSKKALESANLAGENEQIQYLNQQITQK